jgi:hypothetical protein
MVERLQDLRQRVENQGTGRAIHLVGDTYRKRELTQVYSTKLDSWIVGYKVEPLDFVNGLFKRTIYLKLPKWDIMEVGEEERNAIIGAVHKTLLDPGADMPEVEAVAYDCLKLEQNFAVTFWHEGNPNLIVPGGPSVKSPADVPVELPKPDLKVVK